MQKIIDRRVELPYVLSPDSIWKKYFSKLEEELGSKIDEDLVSLFIEEHRNLRDQGQFDDYVNLEFFIRGKKDHVQVNQQLFIIYIYLFHNHRYKDITMGKLPKKSPKKTENNTIQYFDNDLDSLTDQFLNSNSGYNPYQRSKVDYLIFENVSNLSIVDAEKIFENPQELKLKLVAEGNHGDDFYDYFIVKYNNLLFNRDSNFEEISKINNIIFEMLQKNNNSDLIRYMAGQIFHAISFKSKNEIQLYNDIDSLFNNLNFDLSQKIYYFSYYFSHIAQESYYEHFNELDMITKTVRDEELFKVQSHKVSLLYIFIKHNGWWDIFKNKKDSSNKFIIKRIKELDNDEFINFCSRIGIVYIKNSSFSSVDDNIEEIIIYEDYDDENGGYYDNSYMLDVFEDRLIQISNLQGFVIGYCSGNVDNVRYKKKFKKNNQKTE